jgi:hypothetical protein
LGGFIAEILADTILDTLIWGTGALVLKIIRPRRPVDHVAAIVLGLIIWFAAAAALITIGYLLLA